MVDWQQADGSYIRAKLTGYETGEDDTLYGCAVEVSPDSYIVNWDDGENDDSVWHTKGENEPMNSMFENLKIDFTIEVKVGVDATYTW